MDEAPVVIKTRDLVKVYGSRRVVDHVNIEVAAGEIVGLLGPNGAGKTTTFYMIVGLVRCDRGQILLNDTDITRLPIHKRARLGLGYLPQEASVFRKLTVAENIHSVLQLRTELGRAERQSLVEELLEDLHITHVRDSLGLSLSGGERRRVEIARSLAADPKFVLLDEPFAGVDPISVLDIQRIIRHLSQRGIGVLITDHNVRETLGICEHAYILNNGELMVAGTPNDILSNRQVREVYLGESFSL